jgi:hypothetical protein
MSDELIARIEEAFKDVPYPGDEELRHGHPDSVDDFIGRHWKDLPFDFMFPNREALWSFSAEGFHFYLPAFLIVMLKHPGKMDTLSDVLFGQLLPHERSGYTMLKAELFSKAQAQVIHDFLWHYFLTISDNTAHYLPEAIDFWTEQLDKFK